MGVGAAWLARGACVQDRRGPRPDDMTALQWLTTQLPRRLAGSQATTQRKLPVPAVVFVSGVSLIGSWASLAAASRHLCLAPSPPPIILRSSRRPSVSPGLLDVWSTRLLCSYVTHPWHICCITKAHTRPKSCSVAELHKAGHGREQHEPRGARLTWDETTDPERRPAKRPHEIHVSAPK